MGILILKISCFAVCQWLGMYDKIWETLFMPSGYWYIRTSLVVIR